MLTPKPPYPSLGTLIASWWSLTGYVLEVLAAKVAGQREETADAVGNAILDLDWDAAGQPGPAAAEAQGLPPVEPERLVEALRPRFEQALRRAATVMNEDPSGFWSEVTEERIAAIFLDLGEAALEQGTELRVTAAEGPAAPGPLTPSGWAHKYRCMLALEGRWPPVPELDTHAQAKNSLT
jgi:hypothetical protein